MPKLVAGEAEHDQAPGSEAPLQVIHLGVVPHRCASERCYVLNEQHLAPQGGQVEGLPAGHVDVVWGPPRCVRARETTAPAQGNQRLG